jgi:hypothetical protein
MYALHPGSGAKDRKFGGACAWLATPDDIKALARDMERRADDIASVTREECEAMLAKVKALLG